MKPRPVLLVFAKGLDGGSPEGSKREDYGDEGSVADALARKFLVLEFEFPGFRSGGSGREAEGQVLTLIICEGFNVMK